jgi:hypothetical protein
VFTGRYAPIPVYKTDTIHFIIINSQRWAIWPVPSPELQLLWRRNGPNGPTLDVYDDEMNRVSFIYRTRCVPPCKHFPLRLHKTNYSLFCKDLYVSITLLRFLAGPKCDLYACYKTEQCRSPEGLLFVVVREGVNTKQSVFLYGITCKNWENPVLYCSGCLVKNKK